MASAVMKYRWWLLGGAVGAVAVQQVFFNTNAAVVPPNEAFIFVKPHGNFEKVPPYVRSRLAAAKINVVEAGKLTGDVIDKKGIIDAHYAAIAQYAMTSAPSNLPVSAEKKAEFQKKFKDEWAAACKAGKIVNLATAIKELKVPGSQISKAFEAAKAQTGMKLAPGCYVAYLPEFKKYVINGFYGTMREEYTEPSASVSWFRVEWPEKDLSWKDFRGSVLGATDPAQAEPGSIRGKILATGQATLGLPFQPNTGKNCVHGSASPLEALNERKIWLGTPTEKDSFGKQLLQAFTPQQIDAMLRNPVVKGTPLFDLVEDLNTSETLKKLKQLKADIKF